MKKNRNTRLPPSFGETWDYTCTQLEILGNKKKTDLLRHLLAEFEVYIDDRNNTRKAMAKLLKKKNEEDN